MMRNTLTGINEQRLLGRDEKNQSRAGRAELSCRLFFMGDDEFECEGQLLDISIHGCRMLSAERLKEGTLVRVTIFLPDHSVPLQIDRAIVRWVDQAHVGLEYVSLPLEQLDRLCPLVLKAERERALPRAMSDGRNHYPLNHEQDH